MAPTEFDGFGDLENLDEAKVSTKDTRERFPCMRCAGTGLYQGIRVHENKSHCFSCKGKGYFLTSPEKRAKRKANKAKRQVDKALANLQAFQSAHPDVYQWITKAMDRSNDFAASLYIRIEKSGELSEKQLNACYQGITRDEERRKAREASVTQVTLERINELMDTALGNGLERICLRIGDLRLSPAGADSRNPGFIYVKDSGEYAGKINPEGRFYPLRSARAEIGEELQRLAEDPEREMVAYGRRTGKCSCCGRKLTRGVSIDRGIGPICADKFGL